jgi:cytoskeletal protein CcmA (bactofilin family)
MGIFGKSDPKPANSAPRPAPAVSAAPPVTSPTPAAPSPAAAPRASLIGARAVLKGEVLGDDDVVVEGVLEGSVRISRELRVAPGGRVSAEVHAASVVVSGELLGNCVASQRIEIQATGRLTGDIRAPRITIAEGAAFKGRSEMGRGESPRLGKAPAAADAD